MIMESPGAKDEVQLIPNGWNGAKIIENGSLSPGIYYPNVKRYKIYFI